MNEPDLKELGRLVRQHRLAAGKSMDEVATAAKVSKATIHRFEQGSIEAPSPQKLQRIAQVLGVEVEDYFALAGYFTSTGLPTLRPYLRAKYDVPEDVAKEVEDYLTYMQSRQDNKTN